MSELLTLDEVATRVVKKSRRGLMKDLAAGRFGPELLRIGRNVRVRASDVDVWVRLGCPPRERFIQLTRAEE